jgi:hypothetical protein
VAHDVVAHHTVAHDVVVVVEHARLTAAQMVQDADVD